ARDGKRCDVRESRHGAVESADRARSVRSIRCQPAESKPRAMMPVGSRNSRWISGSRRARSGERGVALVVALLAMLVMAAVGAALMLAAATELRITRNFRNSTEALYAADAALERVVDELRAIGDWNLLLSGSVRSSFAVGEPHGRRSMADGKTIDLDAI